MVENTALRGLAAQAVDAAIAAQDAHTGTHEAWLDDAHDLLISAVVRPSP